MPGSSTQLPSELRLSGDGGTAVIETRNGGPVLVFVRDASHHWSQQAVLAPDVPVPGESFGDRLAISEDGDTLAASGQQRALVFARDDAGRWSQEAVIAEAEASPTPLRPDLGLALSASGKSLAVTTHGGLYDGYFVMPVYTLRVYRRDCKCRRWIQQADLHSDRWPYPADTDGVEDGFGRGGIQFDGTGRRLVVGASQTGVQPDDTFFWGLPGAVYVFDVTGAGWRQSARINNHPRSFNDRLGSDLSLSRDGKVLAAGTCGFFSAAARNRNHPRDWDNSRIDDRPEDVYWRCESRAAAYIYTADDHGAWTFTTAVVPNDQHNHQQPGYDPAGTRGVNVLVSGDARTFLFNWYGGRGDGPSGPFTVGGVTVY